jgi:tetratricopeptide (TPR) repeat protein
MVTDRTEYSHVCFVIMPFGRKRVGDRMVDFDFIYREVFAPAIEATALPEGGHLVPKRTDQEFFAGDISEEMFEYLQYSRFALADISGLNPNVFYELGVRHRANEGGTAIFRLAGSPIPFDIITVRAFDYEYEPAENVPKARALVSRVIAESLQANRLDSPAQKALLAQRDRAATAPAGRSVDELLRTADNAIRLGDSAKAIGSYREAIALDPDNSALRLRLGLFLKDRGRWADALQEFTSVTEAEPTYADAWRERGIAENKLFIQAQRPAGAPNGEASLLRALDLNPGDYDGWASLGGVLKREADQLFEQGRPDEAMAEYRRAHESYQKATDVSGGHSYPLLNEIKLAARINGRIPDDPRVRQRLARAERTLNDQVSTQPPMNAPWSFFDLSEAKLYAGDGPGFLRVLSDGLAYCDAYWQPETHLKSLSLLKTGGVSLPELDEGLALLEEAVTELRRDSDPVSRTR